MAKEEKSKKASGDGWFKRFFKGIAKWFRDLKKVSWPSRKTVFDNTVVVLVTMLLTALFVGGLDAGLLKLFELALHG